MPELIEYLNKDLEFPYCAGCGHTMINIALAEALAVKQFKLNQVNLISDIGCVGLVDKMFKTNTVHTTHGRSTAVACGIEIAERVLNHNQSINIVMIGDGGATIGISHLIEAAKLNVNLTVLLHNNFVYGMTGGQNSGLTPEHFRTATSMEGQLVPNINICKLLDAAHAGFLARKLATDRDLKDTIVEAIDYPGFALIEIIELCTGYATKWNKLNKQEIEKILVNCNSEKLGVLNQSSRPNFSLLYAQAFPQKNPEENYSLISVDKQEDKLKNSISVIIAGSAGEGVQFAARTVINSGAKMGYCVNQKNDNPVTIGTGFSLSEIILAKEEILYSAIKKPDYILVSSLDGLKRIKQDLLSFVKQDLDATVLIDLSLKSELEKVIGLNHCLKIKSHDFAALAKAPKTINFALLGCLFALESGLDQEVLLASLAQKTSQGSKEAFLNGLSINP